MQTEPVTEVVITNEVDGRTTNKRKALRVLTEKGQVRRDGKGGKGEPFKYSCSLFPSICWEQQNKNPKIAGNPHGRRTDSCSQDFADFRENEKSREQAFSTKNEPINLNDVEIEL